MTTVVGIFCSALFITAGPAGADETAVQGDWHFFTDWGCDKSTTHSELTLNADGTVTGAAVDGSYTLEGTDFTMTFPQVQTTYTGTWYDSTDTMNGTLSSAFETSGCWSASRHDIISDGWWFIPGQGGTGLSMGRSADKTTVFLAWYVYDAGGQAVWYVSWAEGLAGTSAYSGTARRYTGSEPGTFTEDGNVELVFSGADSIRFYWYMDTPETNGQADMLRYMDAEFTGQSDPASIDGWYTATELPAQGFFIESKSNTLYLGWYGYRDDGTPRWMVLGGFLDPGGFDPGAGSYSGEFMELSNGTALGGTYQAPTLPGSGLPAVLDFSNPEALTLTVTYPSGDTTYALAPYTVGQ